MLPTPDLLRDAVIRVAGSMMRERDAVQAGDALAPRTAEQVEEALCEVVGELPVLSGEAGSFWVERVI